MLSAWRSFRQISVSSTTQMKALFPWPKLTFVVQCLFGVGYFFYFNISLFSGIIWLTSYIPVYSKFFSSEKLIDLFFRQNIVEPSMTHLHKDSFFFFQPSQNKVGMRRNKHRQFMSSHKLLPYTFGPSTVSLIGKSPIFPHIHLKAT